MKKTIRDNAKTSRNIEKAYNDKKYIVAWKSVYQPHYSVNGGFYASEVYRETSGNLTLAGRYFHMTGDRVNNLIGHALLNNL